MKKGVDYTGVTVVFFCHDGKGNVLLSKRSEKCRDEHGTWDPGAGRLEFGHTIEDTLRREILEEYGARVLDYEFLFQPPAVVQYFFSFFSRPSLNQIEPFRS